MLYIAPPIRPQSTRPVATPVPKQMSNVHACLKERRTCGLGRNRNADVRVIGRGARSAAHHGSAAADFLHGRRLATLDASKPCHDRSSAGAAQSRSMMVAMP